MGHEYCGKVVDVGEVVDDIAVGDRVAVEPIYNCGHCAPVRSGCLWSRRYALPGPHRYTSSNRHKRAVPRRLNWGRPARWTQLPPTS